MTLKFACRFQSGALCELMVDLDEVTAHEFKPHFKWNGRGHKPREFIAWIKEIFRVVAARAGTRIIYVYAHRSGESESWIFDPGQRPRRMPRKDEPDVNPGAALFVTLFAQRTKESYNE